MAIITNTRKGEYLKEALHVLKDKGGECPSGELIEELKKRINLTEYERSLNNSGQYRWVTDFRFYSIGLVKGGLVAKEKGRWILKDKNFDFESKTPDEIIKYSNDSYDKWNSNRTGDAIESELDEYINEEPELIMQVRPGDINFQELVSGISSYKIQIPPFQRSFVWSPNDIRYLLDSIYRGYPIGSFIFWRTTRKLPHTRSVGNIKFENYNLADGTEISYVLDGQQRITSLFAAVSNAEIDEEKYRFLFDIRQKKFIVSKLGDTRPDELFHEDLEKLQIPIESVIKNSLSAYRQLCRRYGDNEEYAQVLDTLYDRFVNYRFSVINVLDQNSHSIEGQDEGVKQVVRMFSRINETGKKLTVVAKMVARCWGEGFDLRETLDNFYKQYPKLLVMRDETLLQTASVILNFRKCRSRDILERTNIRKLETEWDEIIKSFLLAVEFITTKLHIKNLDYLPFDAILVPLSYLFHKKKELNSQESKIIEQWFWRVCLSNRYDSTLESKIEEDCVEIDKLLNGEIPDFSYLIDWDSLRSNLISQQYNLRNAFVKTVLALYSYAEPKSLVDGRDVSLEGVFSGYYKHNLHHIFPQAYLRKTRPEDKELFNSVVNIMFIPAITNNNISDTDPATYLSLLEGDNPNLKVILQNHFIFDIEHSGLLQNDYLHFLDYRANQLVKSFRIKAGVDSELEEQFEINPTQPVDIVESKIRNLINDTLRSQTEESYWEDYIPSDIQAVVDQKIQSELKRHPYNYDEYMRDDVRITFLDIMDYSKIILSNWDIFGDRFGSKGIFEQHFRAFKNYRNIIKHSKEMNEVDKRTGEAAILWLEKILK